MAIFDLQPMGVDEGFAREIVKQSIRSSVKGNIGYISWYVLSCPFFFTRSSKGNYLDFIRFSGVSAHVTRRKYLLGGPV